MEESVSRHRYQKVRGWKARYENSIEQRGGGDMSLSTGFGMREWDRLEWEDGMRVIVITVIPG